MKNSRDSKRLIAATAIAAAIKSLSKTANIAATTISIEGRCKWSGSGN